MNDKFYVNEPCVATFFIGELGWFLQRFQGRLRYLQKQEYPNHKFLIVMNPTLHPFVEDFVSFTIGLPSELYALNLEGDGYEAVPANSPPGSLTSPHIYAGMIEYMRNFYDRDKTIELFPPRGCSMYIEHTQQIFKKYTSKETFAFDKPCITVFPRKRSRAANRNIPVYVWFEFIEKLRKEVYVVLAGTPSGACLVDYEAENVINMIKYEEEDKTEKIIAYLNSSICSVSSQSGGTHISLLSGCPSYIIGHEKERHSLIENRGKTPVSFRYLSDYRMIDADTILEDLDKFIQVLSIKEEKPYDELLNEDIATLTQIVGDIQNG